MTKPLISFIIPAYNSQEHLTKCVNSITDQIFTSKNYEIIIINDASRDNTLKICKKLKKINIKIINNKKNLGVSLSRNKGIELSKGEYLFFLDSDDTLSFSAIARIRKVIKLKDADIFFNLPNKKLLKTIDNKKEKNTKDFCFNFFNNYDGFTAHAWNFIVRRKFLKKKKIFFNNIKTFEDQVFTSKILLYADKIKFFSKKICNHSERPNSLGRKTNSLTVFSILSVIYEISNLSHISKLSNAKRIFLMNRISFMSKLLRIYFTICKKIDEYRVKTYLEKINKQLIYRSKKIKFSELLLTNKKINYEIRKFKLLNIKNIFIFGSGMFGRITGNLFLKNSLTFNSFLDNNKKFHGKFCLNKPIISFKFFFSSASDHLAHSIVVLPLDNKEAIINLTNILKNYGLKKRNIKIINWNKIIK